MSPWSAVPTKVDGDPITELMWDQLRDRINQDAVIKVAETTLGADATPITISNIPQTHRNLHFFISSVRVTGAVTVTSLSCRLNNDTGANYDLQGFGGVNGVAEVAELFAQTAENFGVVCAGASVAAAFAGQAVITVLDYANTSRQKAALTTSSAAFQNAAGGYYMRLTSWNWRSAAAVNRFDLIASTGNLITGTKVIVYLEN